MKILVFFSGSLRLDLNTLTYYITEFKKNFENTNYDLRYLFITDKSSPFIYCNYNHVQEELSKHANVIFIEKNKNLQVNTINKYSTISLMYYKHIQNYINITHSKFDYVIKIRNDALIKINEISKYFDNNTYSAPRYWYNKSTECKANDHFIITPFSKFMKLEFSDENINKLAPLNYDTEILTESIFLPDKTIDIKDVLEYVLNGTLKFHIKNNIIISCNFDHRNSLAAIKE